MSMHTLVEQAGMAIAPPPNGDRPRLMRGGEHARVLGEHSHEGRSPGRGRGVKQLQQVSSKRNEKRNGKRSSATCGAGEQACGGRAAGDDREDGDSP